AFQLKPKIRSWLLPHYPPPNICHFDRRDGVFCRPGVEKSFLDFGIQAKNLPTVIWERVYWRRTAGGMQQHRAQQPGFRALLFLFLIAWDPASPRGRPCRPPALWA